MTVGAKLSGIQVGQNPTAANNFVITQGNDGTFKIARGNDGATTQDVLMVDASGRATLPQGLTELPKVNTAQSMVRVDTANGFGSTNTKIRRFTNVTVNQGTDITYADSSTLGASFTINVSGVYAISFSESYSGGSDWMGISLNSAQLTTAVNAITVSTIVSINSTLSANTSGQCSCSPYLPAGSVIRPHAGGGSATGNGSAPQIFTITRVS